MGTNAITPATMVMYHTDHLGDQISLTTHRLHRRPVINHDANLHGKQGLFRPNESGSENEKHQSKNGKYQRKVSHSLSLSVGVNEPLHLKWLKPNHDSHVSER